MMIRQERGIDELIQRVRSEAIEKAKIEREEILRKARNEAQEIIDSAKEKAKTLLIEAQKFSSDQKRKMDEELFLAARDFTIELSERLRKQLFFPVIKKNVRATLKQPEFLKEVLEQLAVKYVKENKKNLDVLVSKELKTTLAAFFAGAIFDHLESNDKKIRLVDEQGVEGFVLIEKGEYYIWDFRADTIAKELARLVEPSLMKYFVAQKSATKDQSSVSAVV